mgnify:CR=1 FL=1
MHGTNRRKRIVSEVGVSFLLCELCLNTKSCAKLRGEWMGHVGKFIILWCMGSATLHMTAIAEDEAIRSFSSLCIEEDSVGFNWEDSDWQQVNFKKDTLIVRKLAGQALEDASASGQCVEFMRPKDRIYEDAGLKTLIGCYSTSKIGKVAYPKWCEELYTKADGSWELWNIDCTDNQLGELISFRPNGGFIRHHISGNVDPNPKNDYKDSLSISHGKCSIIE